MSNVSMNFMISQSNIAFLVVKPLVFSFLLDFMLNVHVSSVNLLSHDKTLHIFETLYLPP